MTPMRHPMRAAAACLALGLLAACGTLPRSGPSKSEILAGDVGRAGDAFVVPVTDHVAAVTARAPSRGFSHAFRAAGPLGTDVIRPGDRLALTVYENVERGLLGGTDAARGAVAEVQVDRQGFVFVPYAGRVRAAGNTAEAVRRVVTARLDEQTPDPQVVVRRVAGDGATVSVVGGATAQGVYPIERPTRTLTAMIAAAGGVAVPVETARVTIVRGHRTEGVFLQDLYRHPGLDIALRDGDRILIAPDARAFTVLGATGAQRRLDFPSETVSAIEALAQVGGLDPHAANPTGVFVLREEPKAVAEAVTGRDLQGPRRVVYMLDLTAPGGLFHARDFAIRDGDTIFVTEAPIVAWNRSVAALFGSLPPAAAAARTLGAD